MALTTLYFAPTDIGATHDGSSPTEAAALFESGSWSPHITGFNFNGSDGLRCLIMPGAYTCTQSLGSSLWTGGGLTAPTAVLPLILHGAAADGSLLTPPNPNWKSCQPAWDTAAGWTSANWPVITTTSVSLVSSTLWCSSTMLRVFGDVNGAVSGSRSLDWVHITQTGSYAGGVVLGGTEQVTNSVVDMAANVTAYAQVITYANNNTLLLHNTRVAGPTGSTGTRRGAYVAPYATAPAISQVTIVGVGGDGFVYAPSNAGYLHLASTTIVGCGGNGVTCATYASPSNITRLDRCLITGNSGYGIHGGNTIVVVTNSRLRHNTSGDSYSFGNYPTDLNNLTAAVGGDVDSWNASEYVNVAGGDYRVKYGSSIWGKGYGVADQAEPTMPTEAQVQSGTVFGYGDDSTGTYQTPQVVVLLSSPA